MVIFAGKHRKINLGGAKSVVSQTDLSHRAKSRRTEPEVIRRRRESARCIQSRWRRSQKSRAVKRILEERFQEDVLGLNGMRALLLIRRSELLLAQWSEAVIHAGNGKPSCPAPYASIDVALPFLVSLLTVPSRYFAGPGLDLTHLPFVYRLAVTICQRA